MSWTRCCAATVGFTVVWLSATNAGAQMQIQQAEHQMTFGLAIGASVAAIADPIDPSDHGRRDTPVHVRTFGKRDVGVFVERTIVTTWCVRADLARGTWVFKPHEVVEKLLAL